MSGVGDVARATALALGLVAGVAGGTAAARAAAPALTITSPGPGYTVDKLPDFQGTSTDGEDLLEVTVYEGGAVGGPVFEQMTPLAGVSEEGLWSVQSAHFLPDGEYTAVAEQKAGEEAGQSAPVTFTVDTLAPSPSMSTIESFTDHSAPSLSGVAGAAPGDQAAVRVRIFAGSKPSGTEAAGGTVGVSAGTWSYTPPPLADGSYTAEVEQSDEAGNTGVSEAQTFTVDTVAPEPKADPPASPTKQHSPTLSGELGTADGDLSAAEVVVYQGGKAEGTVAAEGAASVSGGGKWTFKPPSLEDGTYTAHAIQSDEAGNVGTSAPVTFTVDTVAPAVTMLTPPAFTNDRTPTLEGAAGTLAGDEAYVTVKLYKGTSVSGTPSVSPHVPVESGAWSDTLPTISQDGAYTAVVLQEDEAGNLATSPPVTFVLDTKAPAVTITSPKLAEVVHVSRPTFTGAAGTATGDVAKVTLQIYEVGEGGEETKVQELAALPVSGGSWSTGSEGPHLANGHYTAVAEQADQVGNVGQTKPVPFSIETESPDVTLAPSGFAVRGGALYSGPEPAFEGTAADGARDSSSVTLRVYEGTSATGDALQTVTVERSGGRWSASASSALADGTYTAQAEQTATGEEAGFSGPLTFTVDSDAPAPSISTPAKGTTLPVGAVSAAGSAGTAPGDEAPVTVEVFHGSSAVGAPALSLTVGSSAGAWSAPLGGLSVGTYTVLALQHDDVGNVGTSAPVTFLVSEPAAPPPPSASFTWFPAAPHVGETVSLVSTSTDPTSAIVGYSWSLAGDGSFTPGAQTISTAFTTPGNHVVQLSVIDQNGVSSSVAETIPVTAVPLVLMEPAPVVRIAGVEGAAGVRIRLLTVLAPVGAKVTIACRGRGCPAKVVSALATASKGKAAPGSALIVFRRFQRLLRPGATLEIKVSKPGQIGKYVRFVVRRGKLPTRQDRCLSLIGKPMDCPE